MEDQIRKEVFDSIRMNRSKSFIQSLLDSVVDVNALNNKGTTMLCYAAECGNMEIIKLLLQNGADGNVMNSDGSIPLHMAAMYGHKDVVELFLNLGVFVDSCDNKQWTSLHYAVKETNLRTLDNYLELAQFLVDSKADLNAVNRDGRTPLLVAAQNSPKALVEFLIYLGANVECHDNNQGTLLHHSCRRGWSDVIQYLVEGGSNIDLNTKTARGLAPLIIAAEFSYKDIVKLLIDYGANIDCTSFENWTVLHFACTYGWLDIVKYLVNKKCDLTVQSFRGVTALVLAFRNLHFDIVVFLIESLADNKCTALHHACAENWSDVVEFLINKGCDLNVQEYRWGNTPLHVSAERRHLENIHQLLKAGADFNVKNFRGATAFNVLIQNSVCTKGITLFLENGAYFQSNDYDKISDKPLVKKSILQDMNLCTLAIINKFNNADLPEIYKIPVFAERLPSMEKLKIVHNTNVAEEIARCVSYEIQSKEYCNVLNRPRVLQILCAGSLVEYSNKITGNVN